MGKLIRNGIEYGGGNGTDIFEVTQAEYDALVQAGTLVHNALYVITDAPNLNATAQDISYDGGATTVKQAIDAKQDVLAVTSGTVTPTAASTGVSVLRSTLVKYGAVKIVSVIFQWNGSGSIAFDLSTGFEGSYNVDFSAGDDAGKSSRYRISAGTAQINCFSNPTINSYTTFTVAYI